MLPDYLAPGLDVMLVGINPGLRSDEVGHHFAGPSNRFWKLLEASGLTPRRYRYEEDSRLVELGIGLTNIVARSSRSVSELTRSDYEAGRHALREKIRRYLPGSVAFLGVTVYREFEALGPAAAVRCGRQLQVLKGALFFVLPNPSGRNAHYSFEEMLVHWRALAEWIANNRTKDQRKVAKVQSRTGKQENHKTGTAINRIRERKFREI